jgi:SAM-dependent methyltransferase
MTDTLSYRAHLDFAPPRRESAAAAAWDTWSDVFRETLGKARRRVLDVAPSGGETAFALDRLGHEVHGFLLAPEGLPGLRTRAEAQCAPVCFRAGDAHDLSYPAGVFDGVHARGLFAGGADPGAALLEWYRVLRPGGTAILVEAVGAARPARLLAAAGFVDVREREARLPECGAQSPAGSWLRALTTRSPRFLVAWGRRA